jgi:hypothetical protein
MHDIPRIQGKAEMLDSTIVALVILGGVFVLMSITILKGGVEAAIRLWTVMGALTGIAFGSITTHFFTNRALKQEIMQANEEKAALGTALTTVSEKAEAAKFELGQLSASIRSVQSPSSVHRSPRSSRSIASVPPQGSSDRLSERLEDVTSRMDEISKLSVQARGPERPK